MIFRRTFGYAFIFYKILIHFVKSRQKFAECKTIFHVAQILQKLHKATDKNRVRLIATL